LSLFSDLDVSQGSNSIALPFRGGGIFNKNFIANLLLNLEVQ